MPLYYCSCNKIGRSVDVHKLQHSTGEERVEIRGERGLQCQVRSGRTARRHTEWCVRFQGMEKYCPPHSWKSGKSQVRLKALQLNSPFCVRLSLPSVHSPPPQSRRHLSIKSLGKRISYRRWHRKKGLGSAEKSSSSPLAWPFLLFLGVKRQLKVLRSQRLIDKAM